METQFMAELNWN